MCWFRVGGFGPVRGNMARWGLLTNKSVSCFGAPLLQKMLRRKRPTTECVRVVAVVAVFARVVAVWW